MGKVVITILGLIAVCFLIPVMAAVEEGPADTEAPQSGDSPAIQSDSTVVIQESEILELCPSVTQLPLMFGKPAPCPVTYPLF